MRWEVELYFKALKTGCGVERCRLEAGKRIIRYLNVMSIVAWRILWMTWLKLIEAAEMYEVMTPYYYPHPVKNVGNSKGSSRPFFVLVQSSVAEHQLFICGVLFKSEADEFGNQLGVTDTGSFPHLWIH